MRVSVITAVLNRARVIADCLRSVEEQTHRDLEHVIVDGGSTDGTMDVVRKYPSRLGGVVSEPDSGLYFAINKGIKLATGELIAILGADDVYASPHSVEHIVRAIEQVGCETGFGDLCYVRDDLRTVIRAWQSSPFRPGRFSRGWMPPHPCFFVRRSTYDRLGCYDTRFRIAADYELMLRFLEREGVTTTYIPEVVVHMRTGGASNRVRNIWQKSSEDYRALRQNGYWAAAPIVALKNMRKLPQFLTWQPKT